MFDHNLTDAMAFASSVRESARYHLKAGGGRRPEFLGDSNYYVNVTERQRFQAVKQEDHFRGWTYCCINPQAKRIAGQPIRVAKLSGKRSDSKTRDADLMVHKEFVPEHLKSLAPLMDYNHRHPVLRALAKPNDLMTQWQLMYVTVATKKLTGRAHWMTQPGTNQFWPTPSSWIVPINNSSTKLVSGWRVTPYNAGRPFEYPFEWFKFFYDPDPANPYFGSVSSIQTQSKAIAADEAIQEAQQRAFKNGVFPGMLFTVGAKDDLTGGKRRPRFNEDQRRNLTAMIKQMWAGVVNYGEPMILDALIQDAKSISRTNQEMDFLKSSEHTMRRVFMSQGVNQFVVGDTKGANRAIAVASTEQFLSEVVNPEIVFLSQCLTRWILPTFQEKVDDDEFVFIEPARARDPEMQLKERDQLIKSGSLERNEIRQMYSLPPLPGKAGRTVILMPGQALVPSDTEIYDGHSNTNETPITVNPKPSANGNGKPKPQPAADDKDVPLEDEEGFDELPDPRILASHGIGPDE